MELYHVLLSSLFFTVIQSKSARYEEETRLLKDLLENYDSRVLPIKSHENAVVVKFGIHLQNLDHLDEKKQQLSTNVWLNYEWMDARLKWNDTEYGGVQSIRVPPSVAWVPDLQVYNSYDQLLGKTPIVVYATGLMTWLPVHNVRSSCQMNLTDFPFDTQKCDIKVGSWTSNGEKLNLTNLFGGNIDVSNYQSSVTWDLMSYNAKRNVKKYECCPEPYIDITFSLELKRRPTIQTYILVIPPVLFSLLIPVFFLLDQTGPHRCILGMVLITSMSILIGSLEVIVPTSSGTVSKLGQFYIGTFTLSIFGLMLSTATSTLAGKSDGCAPPNALYRVCTGILSKILCISFTDGDEDLKQQGWAQIAHVLDRLFFLIFFVIIIIMAMACLIMH